MPEILDGKKIAAEIQADVREKFAALAADRTTPPKLVSIVAGQQKDARLYVKMQRRAAESIGIGFDIIEFDDHISQEEVISSVKALNEDDAVTSIIIQHPLPNGMVHDTVVSMIAPEKDAEGIHPLNLGKIFRQDAEIVPCTPGAVMKILRVREVDLYGKNVVIVGHSPIVGKPLSLMMLNETATTSVCHLGTAEKGDVRKYTRDADVLVVAVGKAGLVKKDWVKEGVIIIDVGINNISGKIVGDVDFEAVAPKASIITPVPGGVGPVTVSILMRNVLRGYRIQHEKL